jgi:hypothetical protein
MKLEKVKSIEAQLAIVVGFGLIALFIENMLMLKIVLLLGLVFLLIPKVGDFVSKLWLKFAELLGGVMSKVLLSIVFFIFLMPIAILAKMGNKNGIKLKNPGATNFKDRNHEYKPGDLKNIW